MFGAHGGALDRGGGIQVEALACRAHRVGEQQLGIQAGAIDTGGANRGDRAVERVAHAHGRTHAQRSPCSARRRRFSSP